MVEVESRKGESFVVKKMEKQKSNFKNWGSAEESLKSTVNYFCGSVKCENSSEDNFNEYTYNVAVENLLVHGVCGGLYNQIDDKVVAVTKEHCKKIGVKMPQISISHFAFENMEECVYGMATPSNKVQIRVGDDEKVRQNEKLKEDCLNVTFAKAHSKKKFKIARDFLKQNAINEVPYVYSNILHELEHLKQYALIKDYLNGVNVFPCCGIMALYLTMRVANCKANNNAFKTLYANVGYVFNVLEVEARINTIDKLGKMCFNDELGEDCRQKILDALKLTTYEELIAIKDYGSNYNTLVKQQLNRTKEMFMCFYGETDLGQQVLEDYAKIIKKPNALEKVEDLDKNLMKYAKFVARQESTTKFGQIAQTALNGKIDEIERIGI